MTFGTKRFKNGRQVGYLEFRSGKKVYLNSEELADFIDKIDYWKQCHKEKESMDILTKLN